MKYPAHFDPAPEGGYVVTFRDVPEAITQGDTDDEARHMAVDALLSALSFYVERGLPTPTPSEPVAGERLIPLPASAVAKLLLLKEQATQGVSNAELAMRMGTTPQEFQRIANLLHTTKIDTIERALHALGKTLVVTLTDVEDA